MAWQESWLRVGRALGLISNINETEDLCARVAEMLLSEECPSLAAFVKQVSPGQRVYPQMPSIKDALKTPNCELYLGVKKCSSLCYAKEVDDLQAGVAPLRRVYIYLMLHLAAEKSGRVMVFGLRRKNNSRGDAEPWGRMTAQGSGARGGNKVIMLEYRVWQNAWHDAKAATAPLPRRTSQRKRTPVQGDAALMQEMAQAPQQGSLATKRPMPSLMRRPARITSG